MATFSQAQAVFTLARDFFGQPGAFKSNNKVYFHPSHDNDQAATVLAKEKGLSQAQALNKVLSRGQARLQAQGQGVHGPAKQGMTPIGLGQMTVNTNTPTGNCGLMSCVAMYYASITVPQVPANEMWMVTAYNNWTRESFFGANYMKFGHSWALLGAEGSAQFIVDPWAGVVCSKADFEDKLTAQLNKWARQGKRVWVNYDKGCVWTQANDSNVLSLFGLMATTNQMRGDELFP